MRTATFAPNAPMPTGTYSPAISHGGLVHLAGQGPFDAEGRRVGSTFAEQVRATLDNLQSQAQAAGTDLRHTIRYGVYLKSLDDFEEMNRICAEYFTEPYPVRTTIEVALRGFDVEIDAVIAMPCKPVATVACSCVDASTSA